MKKQLVNNSVVFMCKQGTNLAKRVDTSSVKDVLTSVYSSESKADPAVFSFGDTSSVFLPDVGIGVQVQLNRLTLSDQRVDDFDKKNDLKFARAIGGLGNILGDEVTAYGFNFTYLLEFEDTEDLRTLLKKYSSEILPNLAGGKPLMLLSAFAENEGKDRSSVSMQLQYDDIDGSLGNLVNVSFNKHSFGHLSTEEPASIRDAYKVAHDELSRYLDNL